jgi:hypothetical protein
VPNSLVVGKNAGNLPIQPLFAKISLENICKFSRMRENSLHRVAGNYLREQGNNSAFWIGTGKLAQNRSTHQTYPFVDKIIINRHAQD